MCTSRRLDNVKWYSKFTGVIDKTAESTKC